MSVFPLYSWAQVEGSQAGSTSAPASSPPPFVDVSDPSLYASNADMQARVEAAAARVGLGGGVPPPPPLPSNESKSQPLPMSFEGAPAPPAKSEMGPLEQQPWAARQGMQELTSSTWLQDGANIPYFVGLCAVARDAHADVLEWVEHHLALGVSTIYLYDDGSVPPLRQTVERRIRSGQVWYRPIPSNFTHPTNAPQMYAYDACLAEGGKRHAWLLFIDVDEFVVFRDPAGAQSLPQLLSGFGAHASVAFHWVLFGSSGHETRPPGGVLRSYSRCLPLAHTQHELVKSAVNLRCQAQAWSPHAFRMTCPPGVHGSVRTDYSPIEGPRGQPPVHHRVAVYHYATKSRAEFALKIERGSGMKRQRGWEYFDYVDAWAVDACYEALAAWDQTDTFAYQRVEAEEATRRYRREKHQDHWLKGSSAQPQGMGAVDE
ncbi:hypothetical protein H632_c123p0, partial [Helicosporidium sp. ATCC 50920]